MNSLQTLSVIIDRISYIALPYHFNLDTYLLTDTNIKKTKASVTNYHNTFTYSVKYQLSELLNYLI